MARVAWPDPFPLGVADVRASLGACKALDELVVLRLADGSVLWRAPMDARPLLVGERMVVVLSAGEVLAFSLADADRGALRWRVALPVTPTEAEAAWIDGQIGVHWQSRERYRGGAHPGLRQAAATLSGQCCIDPDSGAASPLADWPVRGTAPQWEASNDPTVLSACVLGPVRYQMSADAGGPIHELKLTATRTDTGSVVWEQLLGSFTPKPAPRLRP